MMVIFQSKLLFISQLIIYFHALFDVTLIYVILAELIGFVREMNVYFYVRLGLGNITN
jgi:hypothetical protein